MSYRVEYEEVRKADWKEIRAAKVQPFHHQPNIPPDGNQGYVVGGIVQHKIRSIYGRKYIITEFRFTARATCSCCPKQMEGYAETGCPPSFQGIGTHPVGSGIRNITVLSIFHAVLPPFVLKFQPNHVFHLSLHHSSCYDGTMKGVIAMESKEGHITRIETSCVQDNQVLALSVNRQDVDRCTKVIRQYGLLMPPVVGSFTDGTRLVLSGECEFLALREMGIKSADAVAVRIDERDEGDKLSLLLSSLRKNPNALSEGLLITRIFKTGSFTQSQLGEMLGKSVSWVNKRICLITRLHPAVRELVTQKHLCPHSAQEIARLPEEIQHAFSVKAIQEGLPKSSVEVLVAAFNAPNCPEEMKEQIVEKPRLALQRVTDIRTAKTLRTRPPDKIFKASSTLKESLWMLQKCMADTARQLYCAEIKDISSERKLLKQVQVDAAALITMIDTRLKQLVFSPGKTSEKEACVHGN